MNRSDVTIYMFFCRAFRCKCLLADPETISDDSPGEVADAVDAGLVKLTIVREKITTRSRFRL